MPDPLLATAVKALATFLVVSIALYLALARWSDRRWRR